MGKTGVCVGKMVALINTVEFEFVRGSPRIPMLSFHNWLRSLGVEAESLVGIMAVLQSINQVARMKMKREEDFVAFMDKYRGEQEVQFDGKLAKVVVRVAGIKETFVRIGDVPFEITSRDRRKVEGIWQCYAN